MGVIFCGVVVETGFLQLSLATEQLGGASVWFEHAVFGLDRWLRRRQGVYEYTDDVNCLFRIQRTRADLRLGAEDSNSNLARIMAHRGFEAAGPVLDSTGAAHRFGESILNFLLVMAANPAAIRLPALSREHKPGYLSRAALERRYAAGLNARNGRGRSC